VDPEASGARTNGYRWIPWPLDTVVRRAYEAGLRTATIGPNQPWFTPSFGRLFGRSWFGSRGYDEALAETMAAGADLTLVVHDAVDHAGHEHGATADYQAATLEADRVIGRVVGALDLSRDTILVTADHGHRNDGGHGGDEPEVLAVPLVAAG